MQKRLFGSIDVSSSQDPAKLSATVTGLIISLSSVIVLVSAQFGVPLLNEQVSAFATQAGLAVGSLWFLYGVIRKGINKMSW